ncbi:MULTISPECIES: LPFR motif small protein [Thermomonosporaceae]|uniref:LPFR motif small protein n=1 Tax=Thermomonosporaceae TaxID=2012 RepID=UPI00345478D2
MGRIAAALQSVIGTIVSVITLPFRVLSQLIGGGRGRPAARRTSRPRRRTVA